VRYWVQVRSSGGNWYDAIGTDDLECANSHMAFLGEIGESVRVVERVDTVLTYYSEI